MNAPSVVILSEIEDHLMRALALLDEHGLGNAAAPYIDLGLSYIRDEKSAFDGSSSAASAG